MDKDILVCIVGLVIFFGIMFGIIAFEGTLRHDCRMHALEKGLPASEILAICK
jgi:hypothetical protein